MVSPSTEPQTVASDLDRRLTGPVRRWRAMVPTRARSVIRGRWYGRFPALVHGSPWFPFEDRGAPSGEMVKPVIDRDGPTPLYVQVADAIQARIEAGELLPDRPIPSENQLVQEYGIARGTARKTIQLLRERGLVVTIVGRGTYVVSKPPTGR